MDHRRIAMLLLASFFLSGCYRWVPRGLSGWENETLATARVTSADGHTREWEQVRWRGDTFVAVRPHPPSPDRRFVSLPRESVTAIAERRISAVETIGAVGLAAGVVAALVVALDSCTDSVDAFLASC